MTTQRDLLAELLREAEAKDAAAWDWVAGDTAYAERIAEALLARGVRVVTVETLAAAVHTKFCYGEHGDPARCHAAYRAKQLLSALDAEP